jgi:hypothetical protein
MYGEIVCCNLDLISLHQSHHFDYIGSSSTYQNKDTRITVQYSIISNSSYILSTTKTKFKMFSLPSSLLLFTLSALTLTTNAQIVTFTNEAQASSALSRVSTYQTYLTAQPEFTSVAQVLETAIPDSEFQSLAEGTGNLPPYTTASWYSALPSDVKSYLSSVTSEEMRLASATGNAAAPRVTGMVGMGVGVVGALGAVLIL